MMYQNMVQPCYSEGMQVTAAYAKANLPELLKAVENGETVQITRYAKPIASLVPYAASNDAAPKLGTAPSSVKVIDPNWAKALTKAEMNDLLKRGSY